MSEEVKDPAIERAWQEVFALCKGREWTMHIPLEETDSDMVISAGLKKAESLMAENAKLREAAREMVTAIRPFNHSVLSAYPPERRLGHAAKALKALTEEWP
jgi:hypothetical protein